MITINGTMQRCDNVVKRQIGGETLLIPITQKGMDVQKIYLLNQTAGAAWDLLEQPHTLNSLARALYQEFDAELIDIESQLVSLLSDLLEKQFIQRVGR